MGLVLFAKIHNVDNVPNLCQSASEEYTIFRANLKKEYKSMYPTVGM